MDVDVGQSEFTPPGCLSLFRIHKPLLGVPFSSQRSTFENSYFLGDITIANDRVDRALSIVSCLYEKFKSMALNDSVLVINTPGWVQDDGKRLLDCIVGSLKPHCLFNIIANEGPNYWGMGMENDEESQQCLVVNHKMNFTPLYDLSPPFNLTPQSRRNLLIDGYMSVLCANSSLNSIVQSTPYAIKFDRIFVHFNEDIGGISDCNVLAALNCTFIALCSLDCTEKVECHPIMYDETMPRLIDSKDPPPLLKCLGFGVIRAIDIERRLFYVLTPAAAAAGDEVRLDEVNVFAKGIHIDLPSIFLTDQRLNDVPYVVHRKSGRSTKMYEELSIVSSYKRTNKRH